GFMTQGNFARCAGCAVNYYDGYATIDGQSVYMETGATASLYYYTPHLGNSTPRLFEQWFGSATVDLCAGGLTAVFRLDNPISHDHLYTTCSAERDAAIANNHYVSEGVAFYANTDNGTGLTPVYRLVRNGQHIYTSDSNERDLAISQYGYRL